MTQTADTLLTDRTLARPVGLAALAFSVIYFVSDLIELAQGGFSPLQLALTYAGEAAIPPSCWVSTPCSGPRSACSVSPER